MSKASPHYLPQLNAPIGLLTSKLDEENIGYNYTQIEPEEFEKIKVSQPFVFSDDVGNAEFNDINPIWLTKDDEVIDGHHKLVKAINDNVPLKAIKVNLSFNDACRILNKIQDIHEYEEQQKLEEVEGQDALNANNDINSGVSYNEFLKSLEEDNDSIQTEKPSNNEKTIIGYRKEPIKENSVIGNFFMLKPMEGYDKYEINFDNLLDTDDLGLHYKDSQIPTEVLAKVWFPHVNFESLSEKYNVPVLNLKNKAIVEKAQSHGFDGIKYGDSLIQGLK